MGKRFTINPSRMIDGAWVINDKELRFAFTPQQDKQLLMSTCKALNELEEENRSLRDENERINQLEKQIYHCKKIILLNLPREFSCRVMKDLEKIK